MRSERREHKRTKVVLPLKMWLSAEGCTPALVQFAHTVDVAEHGARLAGIRSQLKPGDTITLQRGVQKLQFRVKWTKQVDPDELHAGIEALEDEPDFWGLKLPIDKKPRSNSEELLLRVLHFKRA